MSTPAFPTAATDTDDRGPYGVIYRRLWHRPDFRALSFEAKAVYCYARACPAGGLLGIFPLRPEDIRDDLSLGMRRAQKALTDLETAGFIQRLRHWIWLVDAFACTPGIRPGNPKHRTAALKALAQVPDELACAFRNLYGLNTWSGVEVGSTPDSEPIHVDVTGYTDEDRDTDTDKRIHLEKVTESENVEQRMALLRRQAREITADEPTRNLN